jgi:hypothetical protein
VEGVVGAISNFCDNSSQKSPAHNFAGKYGEFAIFKNPSQPKRLGTGGNQSVTICNGLKMVSTDGFSASASSEYF